ncbi:XVIPCD domain-containing protein [Stenotrophomonas rhizophila]
MSEADTEAKIRVLHEQNKLVEQLRRGGHHAEALMLQETYHSREVAGLAADVYRAAAGEGGCPPGWTRASEDPASLRRAGVSLSDEEIRLALRPTRSGFRAEIYLPDPQILGEGAKPVLVFKGSTGIIVDPNAPLGRRESGGEDFLNNGQQGSGNRSDYYDRSMDLSMLLKRSLGDRFEIAGHSLGGGLSSAGSAVSGARATTFNAAGLHAETAARYGRENGLPLFNTQSTVSTYQVTGEVLNDVQNGWQRLNDQQRRDFGVVVNETSMLLREPLMKEIVKEKLEASLPAGAQTAAAQFIDRLATPEGAKALRSVPVAAGKMEILLDPKALDAEGNVVDRRRVESPSQVAELAGPLSHVLVDAARAMRSGRQLGEHVERVGAGVAASMERSGAMAVQAGRVQSVLAGNAVDMGSQSMRVGVQGAATVIAKGQELKALVESTAHRVDGYLAGKYAGALSRGAELVGLDAAAKHLRHGADQFAASQDAKADQVMQRGAAQAEQTRAAGSRGAEVIRRTGEAASEAMSDASARSAAFVEQGYHWGSQKVRGITEDAPAVMAGTAGLVAATASVAARHSPTYVAPENVKNLEDTAQFARKIGRSFSESMARHGMDETVIPSLDAEIAQQEAAARTLLRADQGRLQEGDTPEPPPLNAPAVGINHPANADFHLFKAAQAGVHGIDASVGHTPDIYSDQLAGALAAKAKQEGLQSIAQVVLSKDQRLAAAVDTLDLAAPDRHAAYVDVVGGRQQPLAVSTEQAAEVDRQRAQAANGPQMGAEQRPDGRAMG